VGGDPMGATAIAARLGLPDIAVRTTRPAGLAFDELGGPLVAVCGLAGGAGTSTLALLLARQAAAASAAPVLLTEADPRRAGLCVRTGRATPRALIALAHELAEHRAPTDTFVELAPGLRLIAAEPRPTAEPDRDALRALLNQAQDAHGLVVVDCATSWTAESPVLAHASHLVWTIPATPLGLASGNAQLAAAPPRGRTTEVLVATAVVPRPRVSVRALRKLARGRCDQLVLIPHDEALARGEHTATESTARTIAALAPTLRRRR
jgi:MinD-like ATPase involved in chromosome partitioning or flagellar assembly